MYADKILTCVECGSQFTFTASEQEFHAEKGFTSEPKRCPDCRAARRMDRGGDRPAYRSGGGGGAREMFSAVCANCGKEAQVPFQPRNDRPVYCSDCFRSRQSDDRGGSYGGGGGGYGGGGRQRRY